MEDNYNAIRLIEKRIDGSITMAEASWLEQRLSGDASLRQELKFRNELESIAAEVEVDFLRQHLAIAWGERNSQQLKHDRDSLGFSRFKRYFYAAATLAGITAGGLVMHSALQPKETSVGLYAQHFEPYPPVRIVRSGGELSSESYFFRGMIAYRAGYYTTASDDFEALVRSGDTSTTVRFYLGVSYMELGRFSEARNYLQTVTNSGSLFVDQSVWYTALCCLAEGNLGEARKLLDKLASSDTPMSVKASELIKEMPQ